MYSPNKHHPKDASRQAIKEQKMHQLTILLVNKFRNKYCINTVEEPEIDKILCDEIRDMIKKNQSS